MKEDWKIKQEIYHRLNQSHTDDLSLHDVELSDNIVDNAVKYFTTTELGWVYPAKSYVVAICYARWLSEQYGDAYYDYLKDPDLLYGNDPYFVTYSADPETYHSILNKIGGWTFNEALGIVPDVKQYFDEEIGYE
jgi:hypothetical protein